MFNKLMKFNNKINKYVIILFKINKMMIFYNNINK